MLCLARLHLLPTTSAHRLCLLAPLATLPVHLPPPTPVPSSRHPLPHRSALMSGKNKTASPTAKAGVSPSPTTANDVVYRKEGGRGNRRRERRNGTRAPSRFRKGKGERDRARTRSARETVREDSGTKKECAGREKERKGVSFER